jgi:hypothetical protein
MTPQRREPITPRRLQSPPKAERKRARTPKPRATASQISLTCLTCLTCLTWRHRQAWLRLPPARAVLVRPLAARGQEYQRVCRREVSPPMIWSRRHRYRSYSVPVWQPASCCRRLLPCRHLWQPASTRARVEPAQYPSLSNSWTWRRQFRGSSCSVRAGNRRARKARPTWPSLVAICGRPNNGRRIVGPDFCPGPGFPAHSRHRQDTPPICRSTA